MATLTKTRPETQPVTAAMALRVALGIVLSVVSGLLILLAFPPYGLWPLIWIAFIPYLVAQHRVLPPRLSRLAPAIAIGVWLQPYLVRVFGVDAPWFLKYLGLMIALLNLLIGTERGFHERTGYRWFVLQGAVGYVGVEMIRSFIPMLGTMAFVSYTLAGQPWLLQPVAFFSVYGLNLLVMFFNYALALVAFTLLDRVWQPGDAVEVGGRRAGLWAGGVAAALALWTAASLIILAAAPRDAQTVRAAALQPNFPVPAHIDPDTPQEVRVSRLIEQAREAARQGAQVIYTPELGLAFDPQVEFTTELKALAAETGAYIFLTYGVADDPRGWRNEAVLLTPGGEFLDVYGKNHPAGEPRIVTSGVYPVYDTPYGRLATLICADSIYTDVARRLARSGAQVIAVPTRETQGIAEQTLAASVFRAVENRVAMVKVDTAYSTLMVDPYGRILNMDIDTNGRQLVMVEDVPLGSGRTPLRLLGDWLGWASLAGLVGFTVFMSVSDRRRRAAQ
jgi:apolipoprotein N-acyltransferase